MKKALFVLLMVVSIAMLLAVESAPSAVVGYVKYPCITGVNFVALPLNSGFTMASDIATANPGTMDQISYWDASVQDWSTATDLGGFWDNDFAVGNGLPLMINVLSDFNLYSIGSLFPTNAQYSFVTGVNTLMIPLNYSTLTLSSEAGASIGADQVSYWDPTVQDWSTATDLGGFWDNDFSITIATPLMANVLAEETWPSGIRNIQSSNKTVSHQNTIGGIK